MNLGVGIETDWKANSKTALVEAISDELNEYISSLYFGSGVDYLTIGFICVLTQPGYEKWHKQRKPRFRRQSTVKDLAGNTVVIKNSFAYDITFDGEFYHSFVNGSDVESKSQFAKAFVESLVNLDKLPKEAKNFDKDLFKESVVGFFKIRNLI
tara:strand:+ start:4279 stop:4740 length:462 start_codon:yes stop_codon:yes gene_type:complete